MTHNPRMHSAAQQALQMLQDMELDRENYVSPAYGDTAKAVIFLWGTKIGLGFGARFGRGFLLTKLPHTDSRMEGIYRWSAPLFLKVRVGQAGLNFGHSMVDIDHSFTMFVPSSETKSDVIALASGQSDLVGASVVNGFMLDFSFAMGNMSVDTAEMEAIFGQPVNVRSVLSGEVQPPSEFAPLYAHLNAMISGVRAPAPSLTRASLQRYTTGYDPDRRIITSKSARVLHRGDSVDDLANLQARPVAREE